MLQGYNATIFAYGQTGTGKTHTMLGGAGENRGVIPRAAQQILQFAQSDTGHSYSIQVAFLQLYMEMLQDLLDPSSDKPIRIREDPEEGVYLSGIRWVPINSVKDCMELMALGDRHRNTAFTSMNSHSSRSHAAFMIKLEKRVKYTREQLDQLEAAGDMPDQSLIKSVLYLVDLAGSERVKKSKAVGSRLDEAKNINLALLALGNCIQALADKKAKFVPFRDSKLTRLLEDSLGGNSKTSLIVTIGPSSYHANETISALQFGSRAMKVENRPEVNKIVDYRALCSQLQAELDQINDGNSEYIIRSQQLSQLVEELRAQVEKLTAEKEELMNVLEDVKQQMQSKGSVDVAAIEAQKKVELQRIQQHYQAKVQRQDEEHRKFLEEIDKLILDQERDSAQMKAQISQQKNEKAKLSKELSRLQGELERETNDRDSRISQMTQELEELRGKLATAEEDASTQKTLNTKLATSLQEKETANKAISNQLSEITDSTTAEIKALKQQLQMSSEEIKRLKQTVSEKKKELDGKPKVIAEELGRQWKVKFEEFQTEANQKIRNTELDRKEVEEQLKVANDRLGEQEKTLLALRSEVDAKTREVVKLVTVSEGLKSELDKLITSHDLLSKQLKDTTSSLLSKDSDYKDLLRKCLQRDEQLEDCLQQIRDRDTHLASVSTELQTALQNSEIAKQKLLMQIEEIQVSSDTEKSELVRNFSEKINKLHAEGQKRVFEIEQLEKKHKFEVETLEIRQNAEIEDLKRKFQAEKRSLSDENRHNIESIAEKHKSELSEFQGRANSDISSLKRQLQMLSKDSDSKVEDLREELTRQRNTYIAEIDSLNAQHQQVLSELKSQHHSELASLKSEYTSQLQSTQTKFQTISQQLTQKHAQEIAELQRLHEVQIVKCGENLEEYKIESETKIRNLEAEITKNEQIHSEIIRNKQEEINKLQAAHKVEINQFDQLRAQLEADIHSLKSQITDLQSEIKSLRKREIDLISRQQEELSFMHEAHVQSGKEMESRHRSEVEELEKYWKAQVSAQQELNRMEMERTGNAHSQVVGGLNRKLETAITEKEDLKDKLKAEEQRHESLVSSLRQSQQHLISTISELEHRLEDEKSMHETQALYLQSNFDSLSQKLHLERERATDFECKVDVLRMESVQAQSEISELVQKVSDLERQIVTNQHIHDDELKEMMDMHTSKAQKWDSLANDYQRAISWYLLHSLTTETELNDTISTLGDTQQTMQNMQISHLSQVKSLENRIHTSEIAYQSQKSDFESAISTLITEKEQLNRSIDALNQEIGRKGIELEGLERQLDSTRDTSMTQSAELSGRLKELQKALTGKDIELLNLRAELSTFKENSNIVTKKQAEECKKLENTAKMKENEAILLTVELEKLKETTNLQMLKATERLTQLQQSIRLKDNELSQVSLEIKRWEETCNSQKDEISSIRKQLTTSEGENRQLMVKIRALEQSSDSFRQEKVKQIAELQVQLSEKEKLMKEKDGNFRNIQSELQKVKSANSSTEAFLNSHLNEDFELLSWLKVFIREHKRTQISGHFEFLSYLCNIYSKLQAKGRDTVELFEVSRLVHEKFFEHTRSQVGTGKGSRYFDMAVDRLEKEMEITHPVSEVTGSLRDISLRQQEAMKKKLKKAGRSQRDSLLCTIEHLLLLTELQEMDHIKSIKDLLETRRHHCEPIFTFEQLKACSLVQLSVPNDSSGSGILTQVIALKRLAVDLTALLCVSSSLYSCILAKR